MSKRNQKKQVQRKLRTLRKQYEQVRQEIQSVDFICGGSLTERRLTCGNPKCRCHKDPDNRHGPYYQLSWKEKGKTVSRYLSPDEAKLYREWINNRRRLTAIIDKMKKVSQKAIDCILEQEKRKTTATDESKNAAKTEKKTH